jgi:hypothetical protein
MTDTPPPPSASAAASEAAERWLRLETLGRSCPQEIQAALTKAWRAGASWQRAQSAPPAPQESKDAVKARKALEDIAQMQELNRRVCEIGACIHPEHQSPAAPTFGTATYGMEAPQEAPAKRLDNLLGEAGLRVTFDRFRDVTKGCGPHCKAWVEGPRTEWCENHRAAIESGEFTPPPEQPLSPEVEKALRAVERVAEQPPTPPAAKNIEKVNGSFAERAHRFMREAEEIASRWAQDMLIIECAEDIAAFAQQSAAESEAKYAPLVKAAEHASEAVRNAYIKNWSDDTLRTLVYELKLDEALRSLVSQSPEKEGRR